jgi:hypothetical protein
LAAGRWGTAGDLGHHFIVGSVAAVTETGSLVAGSASGSQLPGYAGAAARAIWVVGAQKIVPDPPAALRRVEEPSGSESKKQPLRCGKAA